MSETGNPSAFVARFRRHERIFVLLWLLIPSAFGLAMAVTPVRQAFLDRVDAAVRWWDGRWLERLREGERLVNEGRYAEAAEYLERLDRAHPARNVRHARDREREYLLRLLARSYEALDRRALTIATYQRLVAFDPNHYLNYFELAQASDRLLSRAFMAVEARDAYKMALDIFPAHLPSLRGYVTYYMDHGEYIPIVEAYERYLDTFLVQEVLVGLGDSVVKLRVPVDGRARDYEVPLASPVTARDVLTIATGGFAVSVERAEAFRAERTGVAVRAASVSADLSNPRLVQFERAEHGAYKATGPQSILQLPLHAGSEPISSVSLRIAMFKPIDRDLWMGVSKSYRNLLKEDERTIAAARTVTLDSASAADKVIERLWAIGVLAASNP